MLILAKKYLLYYPKKYSCGILQSFLITNTHILIIETPEFESIEYASNQKRTKILILYPKLFSSSPSSFACYLKFFHTKSIFRKSNKVKASPMQSDAGLFNNH